MHIRILVCPYLLCQADIIVNSVGGDLNLSMGAVSSAILKAAGPGIQDEVKTNSPIGLEVGQLVASSGGKMKCKAIIHIRVPKWDEEAGKNICAKVRNEEVQGR